MAIARLRGQSLHTLDIPACCIATVEEDEASDQMLYGQVSPEFCQEVCIIGMGCSRARMFDI